MAERVDLIRAILASADDLHALLSHLFARSSWLHEYQSLVGSLIATVAALTAALLGWTAIERQVTAEQRRTDADRNRRLIAARAALPHTLSTLSDYARRSARGLMDARLLATGLSYPGPIPVASIPNQLPPGLVEQLTHVVELTDNEPRAALITLLKSLQVQHARMVDARNDLQEFEPSTSAENVDQYIVDAAEVYARASSLFPYARDDEGGTEVGSISPAKLISALNQLGVRDHQFPTVHEQVALERY